MNSSRPYLLRALHEWIVDNGMTPQVLIDAENPDVSVPDVARANDRIVLNIAPQAVRDLEIDNEYLSFVARFSGVSHGVLVPVEAVQAIYARENGQGMMFPEESGEADSAKSRSDKASDDSKDDPKAAKRPSLKLIK